MEVEIRNLSYTTRRVPGFVEAFDRSSIQPAEDPVRLNLCDLLPVPHIIEMLLPFTKSSLCPRHQKLRSLPVIFCTEESDFPYARKVKVHIRPLKGKALLFAGTMLST